MPPRGPESGKLEGGIRGEAFRLRTSRACRQTSPLGLMLAPAEAVERGFPQRRQVRFANSRSLNQDCGSCRLKGRHQARRQRARRKRTPQSTPFFDSTTSPNIARRLQGRFPNSGFRRVTRQPTARPRRPLALRQPRVRSAAPLPPRSCHPRKRLQTER
jgi:hypothetical protein